MSPDQPSSADLLRTAIAAFKSDILPALPEDKRLEALMILSVMGSAERELADSGGLAARQADRLSSLLPDGGTSADLCRKIREGAFDDGAQARHLHAVLLEDVRDRLSLVNPKYLKISDDA